MANEVSETQTMRDPYAEYADEVSSRPFDGDLLRFTKHGEYKAGQEQYEIEEGTRMILFLPGMKRGWVKWDDGMPVQHIMGLVSERFKAPKRSELDDLDEDEWPELNGRPIDPWQTTNHLPMCDVEGNVYTFITSSKGGLSAVGQVSDVYSRRKRMHPDEIPVVELLSRSYVHKQFGETFAPVFKIIGWTQVPNTFTELTGAIEDASDQTLLLEDLGGSLNGNGNGDEDEPDEEEQEPTPEPEEVRRPAVRAAAKPAGRGAPVKPATRAAPAKPGLRAPVKPVAGKVAAHGAKAAVGGKKRSPRM
jgi:hypothetical protein